MIALVAVAVLAALATSWATLTWSWWVEDRALRGRYDDTMRRARDTLDRLDQAGRRGR